jgi:hypothetical protein
VFIRIREDSDNHSPWSAGTRLEKEMSFELSLKMLMEFNLIKNAAGELQTEQK